MTATADQMCASLAKTVRLAKVLVFGGGVASLIIGVWLAVETAAWLVVVAVGGVAVGLVLDAVLGYIEWRVQEATEDASA